MDHNPGGKRGRNVPVRLISEAVDEASLVRPNEAPSNHCIDVSDHKPQEERHDELIHVRRDGVHKILAGRDDNEQLCEMVRKQQWIEQHAAPREHNVSQVVNRPERLGLSIFSI